MPKRIDTGTPEGEAIGFSGSLFSGWLDSMMTVGFISITSFHGSRTRAIPRFLSEGG